MFDILHINELLQILTNARQTHVKIMGYVMTELVCIHASAHQVLMVLTVKQVGTINFFVKVSNYY
jgi:hypothetical protein